VAAEITMHVSLCIRSAQNRVARGEVADNPLKLMLHYPIRLNVSHLSSTAYAELPGRFMLFAFFDDVVGNLAYETCSRPNCRKSPKLSENYKVCSSCEFDYRTARVLPNYHYGIQVRFLDSYKAVTCVPRGFKLFLFKGDAHFFLSAYQLSNESWNPCVAFKIFKERSVRDAMIEEFRSYFYRLHVVKNSKYSFSVLRVERQKILNEHMRNSFLYCVQNVQNAGRG
jgi:hypothetical protein